MQVRVGGISLFLLQNGWLLVCHSFRRTSGLWTSRADTIHLPLGITCCHIKAQTSTSGNYKVIGAVTTQGCWISYFVVFTQKTVESGFHPPQRAAKHFPWNVEEEVVTATLKIYRSMQSSTDCLCNTNLQADFHWALVPPTHLQPFVWLEMIKFCSLFYWSLFNKQFHTFLQSLIRNWQLLAHWAWRSIRPRLFEVHSVLKRPSTSAHTGSLHS